MQTRNPLDSLVPKKASLFLAAIASMALFLPSGKAAIIISDDFTSGYTNGDNIAGRVTPVGGLTWASSGVNSVLENGGVTTAAASDNAGYGIFTVPFSVGSYTSFSMTASVFPQFNNLNLTFATDAAAGQGTAAMSIWAAVNGGGGWAIYNGGTQLPGSGGTTLPIGGTYRDAVLAYDVTTSTLTFSWNGTVVYTGTTTLSASTGGVAGITRAGFSYNNITSNTTSPEFASFSIAAVPEPQTWALAGLGASAVLFRLRRKQRTA